MFVSPRSFHPFTSSFSKPSVTAPSDFPDKRRTKKKTVKRRKFFLCGADALLTNSLSRRTWGVEEEEKKSPTLLIKHFFSGGRVGTYKSLALFSSPTPRETWVCLWVYLLHRQMREGGEK